MRKTQFVQGNFYHIFNRGVDKREIFCEENDRWRFLQALFLFNDKKASVNLLWQIERTFGRATFNTIRKFLEGKDRDPLVKINVYCLMPNHFHFILEEIIAGGISKFMHKIGIGYTMYFNNKYQRSGALFQGTFKSVLIESQEQFENLLFYINVINPFQLAKSSPEVDKMNNQNKIAEFIEQYPWSTHQEYLDKRKSVIIEKSFLGKIFPAEKYREFSTAIIKERLYEAKYLDKRFYFE